MLMGTLKELVNKNMVFVGMPAYNGERFIGRAIESLRQQSYTNWKMLISDDASTDSTRVICEEYAKRDPRIAYYRQEKNIGQFNNFKFLLDRAEGEYFMWAGHDDLWDKDFIKICVENLQKYPDRGLAFTGHNVINLDGSVAIEYPNFSLLSGPASLATVARFVLDPEILGKPNFMYSLFRLEAIRKTWELYPQQKKWGADILFSLAAISHFGVIVDKRTLFHKRLGGYSDGNKNMQESKIVIQNPKNHIFPVGGGRFSAYLKGHMQALRGTPYRPIVFILLLMRSMRALVLHLKTRNYKKVLNKLI
jgi:glycosyltransferase involved in cell wall biosynthesis